MDDRERARQEREKRHKDARLTQIVSAAVAMHREQIEAIDNFYAVGVRPGRITIYVDGRSERFSEQLDTFRENINAWCGEHHVDNIAVVVRNEPNRAAELAKKDATGNP